MSELTDQLNRPIRDLRISVMDTCNYRCSYCMPEEKFDQNYPFLKPQERLSFEEIVQVVRIFAGFGVNKIRLTGGEPLLRKNLSQLIEQLKDIQGIDDIALTTNGQLLAKQLPALIDAGLDRINISLDSVDEELYHQMSGHRGQLDTVLSAIDMASQATLKTVKINCVVQVGVNEDQIIPLLDKYKDSNVVVRFIEFMDVGNKNQWQENAVMPFQDIKKMIEQHWSISPLQANYRGEVASRYGYDDHAGEIGFITSISQPFCQDCSRARLSADGQLYTCLFANSATELKPLIRNGEINRLRQLIEHTWCQRDDRYSEIRHTDHHQPDKIEMYIIGG